MPSPSAVATTTERSSSTARRGAPIDVLADRSATTLTNWLHRHPGVEIICRDRAGAMRRALTPTHPMPCRSPTDGTCGTTWPTPTTEPQPARALAASGSSQKPRAPEQRADRWAVRARERHAAVYALLNDGLGINETCRRLELVRLTVRRFARAATVEELLAHNGTGRRLSLLDKFKPYLRERWSQLHQRHHALPRYHRTRYRTDRLPVTTCTSSAPPRTSRLRHANRRRSAGSSAAT